ncbi:hypothetical protein [Agromyces sp. NPDC058064]|uniref:hypothetical protein n=1 Tax=Agromyces sp. NPDC058064 TaxID=3346322 RepID=UPI0036DCF7EA
MRKILVLVAAATVLFLGSLSLGVAAALTGAPVFYDARSPHPSTAVDELDIEAGAATTAPGTSDGADDGDGAVPPTTSPAPPAPSPTRPPTDAPAPTPTTPPADPIPTAEEQTAWLAFQQLVRDCMVEAGYEYRHWEWWTTEPRNPNSTAPAMPDGLGADERTAWHAALEGPGLDGTGCLARAAEQDRGESAPPPSPEASTPPTPDDGGMLRPDGETGSEVLEPEAAPDVSEPEALEPDPTAADDGASAG